MGSTVQETVARPGWADPPRPAHRCRTCPPDQCQSGIAIGAAYRSPLAVAASRSRRRQDSRNPVQGSDGLGSWQKSRLSRSGEPGETTMGKLDGNVAIVTGAARGLGRAYALRLAGL